MDRIASWFLAVTQSADTLPNLLPATSKWKGRRQGPRSTNRVVSERHGRQKAERYLDGVEGPPWDTKTALGWELTCTC